MYQNIRLTASKWEVLGSSWKRAQRQTLNMTSGLLAVRVGKVIGFKGELHENTEDCEILFLYCYAFCVSLLLTPLYCDDIHDVTPRVSALAGCDRLVLEPMVIENILAMFSPTHKKSRWGTVFPTGLKRYKEPLVEPKEIR
ncbi:hypothetical protein Tco_0652443 [Tanacetum coccineum]|uniref:Uncharacterized protein n=1 Tax=Tanacetum coccineum TaxID=301880 RepID=A0ABQ4WXN9_9ASTR